MQTRRSGSRAVIGWLVVVAIAASLLVGGGAWLLNSLRKAFEPGLAVGCSATVGEQPHRLAVDQSQNAALISALAVQRGMPARAASIALATALQESKLRNIDYGDMDSVGLFQQRPSMDWGTVEQIMDPVYSTNAFYDVLAKVPDYLNLPINDAAQIVQRSAYPHAYAQHEPVARAFASALTGQSPQALSCTLPPAAAGAAPETVIAAAQSAMGSLITAAPGQDSEHGGTSVGLQVSEAHGWLAAQWAVANAQQFGIIGVSHAGVAWDRENNSDGHNVGWVPAQNTSKNSVNLTLAPPAGKG